MLEKAPTLREVAARAGVSRMTVSRVVNGSLSVDLALRARVEAAITATGYVQNQAARLLATGGDLRLGLLYANPSSGYLNELMIGVLDQASKSHARLFVQSCADGMNYDGAFSRLMSSQLDGVILTPPLGESLSLLRQLHDAKLPCVTVASACSPKWAFSISVDEHRAAFEMTRYLIGLGHSRLGFIAGDPRHSASKLRLDGFRAAVEAGTPDSLQCYFAQGDFTYRSGLDATEELLDLPTAPTAIFASNDEMAAASIAIAHRRGLDVPATSQFAALTTLHWLQWLTLS